MLESKRFHIPRTAKGYRHPVREAFIAATRSSERVRTQRVLVCTLDACFSIQSSTVVV